MVRHDSVASLHSWRRGAIAVLAMLALGLPSFMRAAQNDPAAPSTRPPAGERPQVEDVAAERFEVVSIKENKSIRDDGTILTAGRLTVRNLPLRSLLRYAYRVRDYQLIDLPNWGGSVPFDIEANYPGGSTPPNAQVRAMLRRLLAERFGLVAHEEIRQRPTYGLVRAKQTGELGPDLKKSDVDCSGKTPQIGTPASGPVCTMLVTRAFLRGGTRTMEQLATTLQTYVQAPVLDRTQLSGAFDFTLRWSTTGELLAAAELATFDDVAKLFTALEDQLGLKLEATRGPVSVVVIDAVHRPTPN
jgi:uncharacterized protein (TIGR03435 family)